MYIKIIDKGRESLFECDRYSKWEIGDREVPTLMLEIRGKTELDHEIPKSFDVKVYILNDEGKTIDSF